MAKARKKTRKAAAKRPAKKAKRTTAKLKGRKVAKSRAKPARAKPKKQSIVASAVQAIGDAVRLRTRLGGHNNFEDQ